MTDCNMSELTNALNKHLKYIFECNQEACDDILRRVPEFFENQQSSLQYMLGYHSMYPFITQSSDTNAAEILAYTDFSNAVSPILYFLKFVLQKKFPDLSFEMLQDRNMIVVSFVNHRNDPLVKKIAIYLPKPTHSESPMFVSYLIDENDVGYIICHAAGYYDISMCHYSIVEIYECISSVIKLNNSDYNFVNCSYSMQIETGEGVICGLWDSFIYRKKHFRILHDYKKVLESICGENNVYFDCSNEHITFKKSEEIDCTLSYDAIKREVKIVIDYGNGYTPDVTFKTRTDVIKWVNNLE